MVTSLCIFNSINSENKSELKTAQENNMLMVMVKVLANDSVTGSVDSDNDDACCDQIDAHSSDWQIILLTFIWRNLRY